MREEWVKVGNSGNGEAGNFSWLVYRNGYRNERSSGNFGMTGGLDLNVAFWRQRPKIGRMRRIFAAPVNKLSILRVS